jgi:hypothetical protein
MDVRKVAAAAAGDEYFFADAVGSLDDGDAVPAFAGFGRAEEPSSASAEN